MMIWNTRASSRAQILVPGGAPAASPSGGLSDRTRRRCGQVLLRDTDDGICHRNLNSIRYGARCGGDLAAVGDQPMHQRFPIFSRLPYWHCRYRGPASRSRSRQRRGAGRRCRACPSPRHAPVPAERSVLMIGNLKDWDQTARLGEITTPALIAVGRYDGQTIACSETLNQGIPDSQMVVFEESAHFAHVEETEKYLVVADFLTRVEIDLNDLAQLTGP